MDNTGGKFSLSESLNSAKDSAKYKWDNSHFFKNTTTSLKNKGKNVLNSAKNKSDNIKNAVKNKASKGLNHISSNRFWWGIILFLIICIVSLVLVGQYYIIPQKLDGVVAKQKELDSIALANAVAAQAADDALLINNPTDKTKQHNQLVIDAITKRIQDNQLALKTAIDAQAADDAFLINNPTDNTKQHYEIVINAITKKISDDRDALNAAVTAQQSAAQTALAAAVAAQQQTDNIALAAAVAAQQQTDNIALTTAQNAATLAVSTQVAAQQLAAQQAAAQTQLQSNCTTATTSPVTCISNGQLNFQSLTKFINKNGKSNQMFMGDILKQCMYITSLNGRYYLVMQDDGNLVLYDNNNNQNKILWPINTQVNTTNKPFWLLLDNSGNLSIYDKNCNVLKSWWKGTGNENVLLLQDDGNVLLLDNTGNTLWQTYTSIICNNIINPNNSSNTFSTTTSLLNIFNQYMGGRVSNNQILLNETLDQCNYIADNNKNFMLILQSDGNLVLYDIKNALMIWKANVKIISTVATTTKYQMKVNTSDGLCIIDSNNNKVWSLGLSNNGIKTLKLESNRNLVLYDTNNNPLWATNTGCYSTTVPKTSCVVTNNINNLSLVNNLSVSTGDTLIKGEILNQCKYLQSPSGNYVFGLGSDGNMVLFSKLTNAILWSSQTSTLMGSSPYGCWLTLDRFGNLVLYDGSCNIVSTLFKNTSGVPNLIFKVLDDGNAGIVLLTNANYPVMVWQTNTSNNSYLDNSQYLLTPTTSNTYTQQNYVQLTGTNTDLPNQPMTGSLNDCKQSCNNASNCIGFSRNKTATDIDNTSQCYLKLAFPSLTQNDPTWQTYVKNQQSIPSATSATTISGVGNTLNVPALLGQNYQLTSPSNLYNAIMQSDGNFVIYKISTGGPTWATNSGLSASNRKSPYYLKICPNGNINIYDGTNTFYKNVYTNTVQTNSTISLILSDDGNLTLLMMDFQKSQPNQMPFMLTISLSNTSDGTTGVTIPLSLLYTPNSLGTGGALVTFGQSTYMYPGDILPQNTMLVNGNYNLSMQSDGNLVIYNTTNAIWNTATGDSTKRNAPYVFTYTKNYELIVYDCNYKRLWYLNLNSVINNTPPTSNDLPILQLTNIGQLVIANSKTIYWTNAKFSNLTSKDTGFNDGGGGNIIYLDRHTLDCSGGLLNEMVYVRSGNNFRYNYNCLNVGSEFGKTISTKSTPSLPEGDTTNLKDHNIDCGDSILSKIHYLRDTGGKFHYDYSCVNIPGMKLNKKILNTPKQTAGANESYYLDRHDVKCDTDEVLTQMQLNYDSNTRQYNYQYTCAKPRYTVPNPLGQNYVSGGVQNTDWKYTTDPNDTQCANNWNYYNADGTTLIEGNIKNISSVNDTKSWCPIKNTANTNNITQTQLRRINSNTYIPPTNNPQMTRMINQSSNLAIENNGPATIGNMTGTYTDDGLMNKKWDWYPVDPNNVRGAQYICNHVSNNCLENGGALSDGNIVAAYPNDNNVNKQWNISVMPDNQHVTICNVKTNNCLENNGPMTLGNTLAAYPANNSSDQSWSIDLK